MKAKNSKEVTKGYLLFALTISLAILTGTGCIYALMYTAGKEVADIESRLTEYDAAFVRQISISEKTDSLFNNLSLLNSEERLSMMIIQNRISTQKMQILDLLSQMNKEDAAVYHRMSDKINSVLQTKDSIKILSVQEQLLKKELQRCIQDHRSANRNRYIGNTGR